MTGKRRELSIQTDIIQSVRRTGGYARKLSNRFQVGVPDLLVVLFPFAPFVSEVKDMGELGEVFSRKISITEKQRHELLAVDGAYREALHPYTPKRRASVIMCGYVQAGVHWLAALPAEATHVTHRCPRVPRMVHKYYDIRALVGPLDMMAEIRP